MGQKINPIIFRLGVTKTWKTEFFEKKNHELPLYTFKDLEIKSYIERILESNGILLHDYKQHYNDSTLNLYMSYFVTPDVVVNKKDTFEKIIVKNSSGKRKTIKKLLNINPDSLLAFIKKEVDCLHFNVSRLYKIKHYLNSNFNNKFSIIQPNKYLVELANTANYKIQGVFAQVFRVLTLFMGNPLVIITNFCCVNKNLHFLKSTQKKTFLSLQKFKNTPFLKEGLELLFHVVYNENSAHLLAKFIAFQLRKIKRHKFLLSFLKQTLTILLTSSLAKIKGVKIIVKGRLNGVPRAKHKIIIVGDVPVQSISTKIDYSQTTAHNSNGSYGVKVWIVEK